MNKYIIEQWKLINKHCIQIGKIAGVEMPDAMKVTSGNPYERMRNRTTALAGFLGDVASSLASVEGEVEKAQPEVEAVEAKIEETKPKVEVAETVEVEAVKPPKKTSRRKK